MNINNTSHIHMDSSLEIGLSDSKLARVPTTVGGLDVMENQLSMGY